MSITTLVASAAKRFIDPFVPARTTAAFEVMNPPVSFNVNAVGLALPVSQAVSHRIDVPKGTTAMFNE
jgi:hypothetical protein